MVFLVVQLFHECRRNLADKSRDGIVHGLSVKQTVARVEHIKLALGACDRNVGKTAFLFHLALARGNGLHSGEQTVLHAGKNDNGKLQALCAVDRHHDHRVGGLVVAVHVGNESRFLKKARKRRLVGFLHVFENTRLELVKVFKSVGFLSPRVDQHLTVARAVEHRVVKHVERDGSSKGGERVDQRGKLLERGATALQRGKGRGAFDDRELTAALLLGDQRDGVKGFCTDLTARLVDDTRKTHVVVVIVDELKISDCVTDLLAVGKARTAKHAVGNCRARKGFFDTVCLRVGAVEDGKIAVGRLALRDRLVDRVYHKACLGVLVIAELQVDLLALARRRPKRFALASRVVRDHGVCRVENGLRGAVILLQLYDLGLREGLVKGKNVFDGRTAELVNALVVVAHNHQVLIRRREQDSKL